MIFVSVGTYAIGFDRLIREVDRLAADGIIKDVFCQIGGGTYIPTNTKYARFITDGEMCEMISASDFLIVHGGVGILSEAIKLNKKIIAFPKQKRHKDYFNDHQLEIVTYLEKKGMILAAYELKDLEVKIFEIPDFTPLKQSSGNRIPLLISEFIVEYESSRMRH